MPRLRLLVAIVAMPAVTGAASFAQSPADAPITLQTEVVERGWIRLKLSAPQGSTVQVNEIVAGVAMPVVTLSMQHPSTGRRRFAAWRCDRLTRIFEAVATSPNGATATTAATVATPGCTRRLQLDGSRGRLGSGLTIRIRDRFLVGEIAGTLAPAPAGARLRCRPVSFARDRRIVTTRFDARRAGRWRLELRTQYGQTTRGTAVVRRAGGRFRLLATGDSMIQIIDSYLAQRLKPRGAQVRSDAHISTGISKPSLLDWVAHARASARAIKPDVTVVFLGANDGFPIAGVACCADAWVKSYAERARRMMAAYVRHGRGRVYWLLLPAPRGANFARVFRGVNAGVLLAAANFSADEVRVLDLRRVFTLGGKFRTTITYRGSHKTVRQADGVHLNASGASIAADIIARALRADGFVAS